MKLEFLNHSRKLIFAAVISAFIAGIVSSGHHWYGAIVYETPWRVEVSYWILGIMLIIYSSLFFCWKFSDRKAGKFALWVFFLGAVVFQTGFTLFECVYSHVLKNMLYFAGASQSILEELYPLPTYHLPDNLFFEFTGLLQLLGFVAAWFAYLVFRDRYG